MPTIEPRVIPDDYYSFDLKDLNTSITAVKRLTDAREVMHPKEAAAFIGTGVTSLYKCKNIPHHKLPGLEGRLKYRSELIDFIKRP
jgi:hypothetical protein